MGRNGRAVPSGRQRSGGESPQSLGSVVCRCQRLAIPEILRRCTSVDATKASRFLQEKRAEGEVIAWIFFVDGEALAGVMELAVTQWRQSSGRDHLVHFV